MFKVCLWWRTVCWSLRMQQWQTHSQVSSALLILQLVQAQRVGFISSSLATSILGIQSELVIPPLVLMAQLIPSWNIFVWVPTSLHWLQTELNWTPLKPDVTDPSLRDHDSLTWFRAAPQRFQGEQLLHSGTCMFLTVNSWCTRWNRCTQWHWVDATLLILQHPAFRVPAHSPTRRVRDNTCTATVISLTWHWRYYPASNTSSQRPPSK